jgi:replication factor A1
MNISELQAGQGKIDVTGIVTEIGETRTFDKFGKSGQVANAKIKDDSGEVALTLWNDQVDQVKVGDKVNITNGYVREWQGELQLSTGKFGKLEVVSEESAE